MVAGSNIFDDTVVINTSLPIGITVSITDLYTTTVTITDLYTLTVVVN
jgi:hypothetical protein